MLHTKDTLTLIINDIQQLTSRIRSYMLCPPEGEELPLVSAGAHLAVPVTINGHIEFRNYSIYSNPTERHHYKIAVLREIDGRGGSAFIHDHFTVEMELECKPATNNFHLHADASPAVFIAGGIGITPIMAMAQTLALRGRRFNLHYAGRSKSEMPFVAELQNHFDRQVFLYPADEKQRLDIMHLLADAPSNTQFYICGPQKLLDEVETCARMLGIAKDRIQSERFLTEKFANDKSVVLELARSNKFILVNAEQSLLTAVRDAGINTSFDCCVGECGACAVKILEGEPDHRDHVLSDAAKAEGMMCLCVSRAKSEKLVVDI